MTKILLLSDNFPPEHNAGAIRAWEQSRRWVKWGAEVTVITCAPNFPSGRLFAGYRNRLFQREWVEGVEVIRVWSFMAANERFIRRTLDYLSFAISAFFAGLQQRPDVIIATSPQFFTALSGWLLSVFKRCPWIFEVRDLWPESIATVGALRMGVAYRLLEKLEMHLYRQASAMFVVSEGFRTRVTSAGIPSKRIYFQPNGCDPELFFPQEGNLELRSEHKIGNKFLIGYIGTLGLAHGLEFILSCAAAPSLEKVHFLFVGEGARMRQLRAMAANLQLTNVTFEDAIPREQVPRYLAICDAALVHLRPTDTFKTVIPSKIFEAAAMRRPILLGVGGVARDLVAQFHAGICYNPGDPAAFVAAVGQMAGDTQKYKALQTGCDNLAREFDRDSLARRALDIVGDIAKVAPHPV